MKTEEFIKRYYIDRNDPSSIKWSTYRKDKALPMWIADMDFKCDEKVIEALKGFIEEGDYGYHNLPEDYYDVFIGWHRKRNDVVYDRDWIRFSKGAVDAMNQIIYSLTEEGDKIMINTPLYPPFKATILGCGRKVVESRLIRTDDYFTFDFKDMENKFKRNKVKMLMLCSPHNPIGRVYKEGELQELLDLCKKYNVLVCSDEVHSDIIMPDQTFIPIYHFKKYRDILIAIVAASKSFSLAVYSHSHIIIANRKLRKKLIAHQQKYHLGSVNAFNALPTYYCYRYGEEWMDSLDEVIYENYQYVREHLGKHFKMTNLEGSYLLFLDLGRYNDADSAAKVLFERCKLKVNPGESFGKEYKDWVRINLATSKDNIRKAVRNILSLTKS